MPSAQGIFVEQQQVSQSRLHFVCSEMFGLYYIISGCATGDNQKNCAHDNPHDLQRNKSESIVVIINTIMQCGLVQAFPTNQSVVSCRDMLNRFKSTHNIHRIRDRSTGDANVYKGIESQQLGYSYDGLILIVTMKMSDTITFITNNYYPIFMELN